MFRPLEIFFVRRIFIFEDNKKAAISKTPLLAIRLSNGCGFSLLTVFVLLPFLPFIESNTGAWLSLGHGKIVTVRRQPLLSGLISNN
ncbi:MULTISPECIES: hypothetical protein [Pseudomonas]|uniref:Uncharacterized protein n=1 Tax=Pseudomonas reactans TaxID=117680 RepID=A0A7Y8KFZ4_9PSED|nr:MULTISPECIES: hypothetical protein [Pseudomonas]NWA45917.1 hypothetical protein [Pseudomonas reactans]NWD99110.1 hypothetical protein [Pseudomonas reactans]NWE88031.1 hypothetical protein [Pseudomonas reactans]OYQ23323.1 hypothetical protein B7L09_08045 [Pseudomonas mandelii]